MQTQLVKIAQLVPSPFNPRKAFDKENMAGLVESVKAHGVLEPILVRPFPNLRAESPVVGYQIIAGWRRYLGAQQAGLKEVPCLVREMTDADAREIQMIENVQREGISELEEALGRAALRGDAGG